MISNIAILLTYLIVIALLCWVVIFSKGHIAVKTISILVCIWYCFSFYYIVNDLKGWPVRTDLPQGAKIISFRVVEPDEKDSVGAFYFWLNLDQDKMQNVMNILNPQKFFNYTGNLAPRAYQIPYDRELHKRLLERQKQQKEIGGSWMEIAKKKGKKEKDGGKDRSPTDQIDFKIINPIEILTKPEN